jgi:hypothetical protein
LNQLKSKKSIKSELTEQIDNNNNTQITTDLISPLSIHSASINTANTTSRRSKSESENQMLDQLNNSVKLLEIPAINYNKLTPLTNQQQRPTTTTTTTIKTNNESFISNSKNLELLNSDLLSSNKIPHPPPQSTRPVNSSARKLRLSSAVQQKNNKQQTATNTTKQQQHQVNKITNGGESSSNEEDIQNNSSKTLIEYSPFKNKAQQNNNSIMINESITDLMQGLKLNKNLPTTSRPKSKQLETIQHESSSSSSSSNKNLVYSFSSRPKPAGLIQKKDNNNNTSNNNNNGGLNKIYDFTKYSTNSAKSLKNSNSFNETGPFQVIQNETTNLSNKRKLTQPFRNSTNKLNDNNNVISADLYDSIDTNMKYSDTLTKTNNNNETYNEVVDSFEAKMLLDMKAEMDSGVSTNTKTNPKIQVNNVNNTYKTTTTTTSNELIVNEAQEVTKKNLLKPEKEKSNLNPKSPDAEYFENIRLEANGIHSPMSDDNNPTSEKYNFDAITSSIDETTTSISKKTVNFLFFC